MDSRFSRPNPLTMKRLGWSISLSVLAFCTSVVTSKDYGMAWDEAAYLESVYLYGRWFAGDVYHPGGRFSRENLHKHWGED